MTEPDDRLELRLYGMMQHLMMLAATGRQPEAAAPREVVTGEDAVDAVLQIAAVIDEAAQAGQIPPGRAAHAGAMLMMIRDYVRPLPVGPGEDGTDGVVGDLEELARILRRTGGSSGVQG
jgi:hypothetical protein